MFFLDCWIKILFMTRQADKSRSRNSKNHSGVCRATVTVSLLFWERDQTPSLLLVWCNWTARNKQQWPHSCLVSWVMTSPSTDQLADGDECHEAHWATSNFSSLIQAIITVSSVVVPHSHVRVHPSGADAAALGQRCKPQLRSSGNNLGRARRQADVGTQGLLIHTKCKGAFPV